MGCPYCGGEVKSGRTYCSRAHALMHNHSSGKKGATKPPKTDLITDIMAQPEIEHLRAGIKVAIQTAVERVLQG